MTSSHRIRIKISEQKLYLQDAEQTVIKTYPISSSAFGIGNQSGSYKTPLGEHIIVEKIGDAAAEMEVFIARKPRGKLSELEKQEITLPEDIITSRILWLQGQQPGINQGGDVDSYQRYIYIHGTSEEDKIGRPASHGCIRMMNADVIELYDLVSPGCPVSIEE